MRTPQPAALIAAFIVGALFAAPLAAQEFTIDDILAEVENCDDPGGVSIEEKFARRVSPDSTVVIIGYGERSGVGNALSFDLTEIDRAEVEQMFYLKFYCKYAGCITTLMGSKKSPDKRKFTTAKIAMCSQEYNELISRPLESVFPVN